MSVLALHKRLQEKGVSVNLKSLYRLAGSQPLQKFDARIVKPICFVLGVDLSELISLEKPELSLLKLEPATQARITGLLNKNKQGTITEREMAELERLVEKAEKISLHNARALVEYRRRNAAFERLLLRSLGADSELREAEGGGLSDAEFAERLGLGSRETIRQYRGKGRIFGWLKDSRSYRYPAWQIHRKELLPGLAEVLAALPRPLRSPSSFRYWTGTRGAPSMPPSYTRFVDAFSQL